MKKLVEEYEQGTGKLLDAYEIDVPDEPVPQLEKLARILEVKGYLTAADLDDVLGA
jgi:hypothetical protein